LPEGQVLRPADLHQSTAHGGIGDREFDMLARLVDKSLVVTSVPGKAGLRAIACWRRCAPTPTSA
jgi:hypothetical protein